MNKSLQRIIAIAAFSVAGIAQTSQAETLAEVYQQALENDHTFRAAKAALEAGLQDKNLGRAGLLPQINGSASWQNSTENTTGNTWDRSLESLVDAEGETKASVNSYSISLSQTLFNLASWHTFQQGKVSAKIAQVNYLAAEQNLMVRAAQAYFDALAAVDALETAKSEEEALKHQLEQTKQRFEVGLTAITEVHEAQAAFDSSTASRLAAEGRLGIAFEALEVITGRPYTSLNPMRTDFPVTAPEPTNRQDWVEFALQNNVDLKAASLRAEVSQLNAKAKKADHFPTVTAGISHTNRTSSPTIDGIDGGEVTSETQAFNVTVNIPIYAGGATHATRRQANAQAWEAREALNQTQRDIIQQARSSHLEVMTGVATVKARKQAITSSESALRATQAGYEVGTRDLVHVLQAQRSLFLARRNYSDALFAYVIDTLKLKQVAGTLSPADIEALSNWLDTEKQVTRQ